MTVQECREDLERVWDANPQQRSFILLNAGWNAFGEIDNENFDPAKAKIYKTFQFSQLPADMQERMVAAYHEQNKE